MRRLEGELRQTTCLFSPAALLELEYLHQIRRIKATATKVASSLANEIGLKVCDLPFPQIVAVAMGEKWVRDPFDRLIVGHAKANRAPLLTKDEHIHRRYRGAVW